MTSEGNSVELPPYYSVRATWWKADKLAFGLNFNHAKIEADNPVLFDLDGGGITITERSRSSVYLDGGDGKEHRTAWAGAGDGVLFFDAGMDGRITEKRENVFTEWTQGSTSDLEAVREKFDTNGDGKLTAADSQWSSFKVMVTNADGTTTAKTLTELGITEIDLRPDATNIELPDGSVITGQTTFVRNGVTRTVADTVFVACTGCEQKQKSDKYSNAEFLSKEAVWEITA